jgi:hypothetical protein
MKPFQFRRTATAAQKQHLADLARQLGRESRDLKAITAKLNELGAKRAEWIAFAQESTARINALNAQVAALFGPVLKGPPPVELNPVPIPGLDQVVKKHGDQLH